MKLLKVTDKEWAFLRETVALGEKNFGVRESMYASENRGMIRLIGTIVRNIAKRNSELIK